MKCIFYFIFILICSLYPAQAQLTWTPINSGLTDTIINTIYINGSDIFVGTVNGGVFLSTNNGQSWTQKSSGLTELSVYSIASSGSNLFAATMGGGVFLSTNNGTNWTAVNNGLTSILAYSLVIKGPNVMVGTYDAGVFLTTNNGTNWTAVNSGLNTNIRYLNICDSNIFAGTESHGVYLSTNYGTNWTAVNNGLPGLWVQGLTSSGTNVFTAIETQGVFLSTDNGTNWIAKNNGLTDLYVYYALSSRGSNILVHTQYDGVFLSTNNGASWTAQNNGLPDKDVKFFAISDSNVFAGTYGGGIFKALAPIPTAPSNLTATTYSSTRINLSWSASLNNPQRYRIYRSLSSGSGFTQIDSVTAPTVTYNNTSGLSPATTYYYKIYGVNSWGSSSSSNEANAKTFAPGWSLQTSGISGALYSVKAVSSTVAWASGQGKVFRTTNGGITWNDVGGSTFNMYNVESITALDAQTAFAAYTSTGTFVYRTTNGGSSWQQVFTQSDPGYINGIHMYDPVNGIAYGDPVAGKWTILKTTNGGASWFHIPNEPTSLTGEMGYPNTLVTISNSHIWFGTNKSRVFYSTDKGNTWATGSTSFVNSYGLHFLSTSIGVVTGQNAARSTNGGVSWTDIMSMPGSADMYSAGGVRTNDFWVGRGNKINRSTDQGGTWYTECTFSEYMLAMDFITIGPRSSGWVVGYNGTIAAYTDSVGVLADEPAASPTNMVFSNVQTDSMRVSFTAAAGTPGASGYIVIRSAGSAVTAVPSDGISYYTGQVIGSDTVTYVGSATTFPETGLMPVTNYYYKIFSFNGSANLVNYLTSSSLSGNCYTLSAEPASQPSNLVFSNVKTDSMRISFTAATGNPSGYIAIRSAGTQPVSDPVDGTSYTAGQTIGSDTVAYVGSAATFWSAGLAVSTRYHYRIYSYNGSANTTNYLTDYPFPLSGYRSTLAVEPAAQPTNLLFTSVVSDSVSISFQAAAGATGYITLRRANQPVTDTPQDGISYAQGSTVGSSAVAHTGSETSFHITDLSSETRYYFAVFSYRGGSDSVNYVEASPLTGDTVTSGTGSPPSAPTSFNAIAVSTGLIDLSWTASATGEPLKYYIFRSLTSGSGFILADSVTAPATTKSHTVPSPATSYYFHVKAANASGLSEASNEDSATTFATGWKLQNSGFSGNLTSVSAVSPSVAWAAGLGGKVLKTTDGGVNWITADGGAFGTEEIKHISGLDGNTAFVTTNPVSETFIYRTTDGGSGWHQVFNQSNGYIDAVHMYDPVNGIACGDPVGGKWTVLKTTNGGASWYRIPTEPASLTSEWGWPNSLVTVGSSHIWFGTNKNRVMRSTDGGFTWSSGATPFLHSSDIHFTDILTGVTGGEASAARTTDGGATWISIPAIPGSGVILGAGGSGNGDFWMSHGTTMARSTDQGTNWFSEGTFANSITAVDFVTVGPYTSGWIVGADGMVAAYSDTVGSLPAEPTASPANIVFSNVLADSMRVSFSPAPGGATGYIAIRSAGTAPATDPADGISYYAGQVIGGDTVAYVGPSLTFVNTGLAPGTKYFYKIYSYNGANALINYRTASPLEGDTTAASSGVPPSPPSSLTATAVSSGRINLAWTGSVSGNPTKYFIYRKDGPAYLLHDSVGAVQWLYVDSGQSVNPSTTYSYQVYASNAYGFSGPSNEANATTFATEPASQPVNLAFADLNFNSYTLVFNQAADLPAGYLILKKTDGSPTAVPSDGTEYTAGSIIGTDTVVYAGSDTSVNLTGLAPSTVYYFDVFSYNGNGLTVNYLAENPLEGSRATLQTEPPQQPTALVFSSVHSDSMRVSFTGAIGGPAGYIVLRNSIPVVGNPADGTAYTAGETIGTDSVVYAGSQTTFGQYGLASATRYYFKIFSYNGNGPRTNYLTVSPLTGDTVSSGFVTEPAYQPTNLVFSDVDTGTFKVTFNCATDYPLGYLVLRSEINYPNISPTDGQTYSPGAVLGNARVVTSGSDTSYNEIGLFANTIYYYHVYSFNGTGSLTDYLTTNPLTGAQTTLAAEPTAQPTELSFEAVSSDTFKVDFKDAAPVPTGYIVLMKTGSLPSAIPSDGTVYTAGNTIGDAQVVYTGNSHEFDQTGAVENTTYFYKIFSYNGNGEAIHYLKEAPLTGQHTHISPPKILSGSLSILPANPSEDDSIKITVPISGTSPAGYLTFGNGSHTSAFTVRMNSNGTAFFATIPPPLVTREGVVYRIKAVNAADSSFFPASGFISIPIRVANTAAIQSIGSYPDGIILECYNTISLPLNSNIDMEALVGPSEGGTVWRLVTHAPTEWVDQYVMENNKAYFFYHRKDAPVQLNLLNAVTNSTGLFENFRLHPEWNLVPWPYAFKGNITWRDPSKIGPVWQMTEGAYDSMTTTLKPFGGYVIFNKTPDTVLIKDVLEWSHVSLGKSVFEKTAPSPLLWSIHFQLRNEKSRDLYNLIGVSEQAAVESDPFDDAEPISPGRQTHVYFSASETGKSSKSLACDIRSAETEGHAWDITVERRPNETYADLSWSVNALPEGYSAVLYDFTANRVVNLLENHQARISGPDIHRGKVIAGTSAFILGEIVKIRETIPERFALHPNFPNPFNPNTTIRFDVAKTGRVKIQIYNVLGQLVNTLVNSEMETGKYDIQWNGKDARSVPVSSGIYICRLVTDGYVKSRKMVLVR